MSTTKCFPLLWLLQLSDTALPIGGLNHSFGLETVAAEELLNADGLEAFLRDYVQAVTALEMHFSGAAYRLGLEALDRFSTQAWLDLNTTCSAFKLARENRLASATLGRRFLALANGLSNSPLLLAAGAAAHQTGTEIHHCVAFGLTGAALGIEVDATLLAYGHQSIANLISACQRLLPVGQMQATRMLWELKPVLAELVKRAQDSDFAFDEVPCFAPLIEMASMRHPTLPTRLFIS